MEDVIYLLSEVKGIDVIMFLYMYKVFFVKIEVLLDGLFFGVDKKFFFGVDNVKGMINGVLVV